MSNAQHWACGQGQRVSGPQLNSFFQRGRDHWSDGEVGCGDGDQEFAEEGRHLPIAVSRATVGVEALHGEGKRGQQLFQSGNQIRFTDVLHRTDRLKLRDLIHRIDGRDALLFVAIPLMDRIDAEKPGLACRRPTFPDA